MHSTILTLLASTVLVSATACPQHKLDERLARLPCASNKEAISECLSGPIDGRHLNQVRNCLVAGGCSTDDATAEVTWWSVSCATEKGEWEPQRDLKNRQDKDDDEETTNARRTTTSPSPAQATTTSDSTIESATSTIGTTPIPTLSTSSTTSALSVVTYPATDLLICSVTSTKSTTKCSISAGHTVTCLPTTITIATCAPGMICFPDRKGAKSCMLRKNEITTSGLVVAIALGVGLSASLIAVIVTVILGRKKKRAMRQAHFLNVAAGKGEGGGEDGFARRQMVMSDAALPLIPNGGRDDRYTQQEHYDQGPRAQGESTPESTGANPEAGITPVPKLELHQGLGGLGQNPRY
ncbi:uncharacterized protein RSE6_01784 [Rhynchosporium secalis]|uniref:Extracellular membrane protein CFEM domain-containing protein n=1 Tax=Rhynchosporium secalis TaxID=38038 RepID=A0A1E1LYP2_RHYSE|nr:uncharacterized protein RSE6_01784 [Rhynchosporium secalis]